MYTHPTVRLGNGLHVANFSSPHPFTFTTGEVLAACDGNVARELSLDSVEAERVETSANGTPFTTIRLEFRMTEQTMQALERLCAFEDVDVVLVAFPVLSALRDLPAGLASPAVIAKARTIRTADRVTKAIYPDRFCA